MLVDGLYYLLSNNAPLVALLGSPTSRSDGTSGVFSIMAPKEVTTPYVVFQQVSMTPVLSLGGVNELQEAGFQFSCYAASYKVAKQVAFAVRNALNGLLQTLNDGTIVEGAYPVSERDNFDPDPKGSLFGVIVDFDFHYLDADPAS